MFSHLDKGGEKERLKAIEIASEEYPVLQLCKLFKVARSSYYAYLKRKNTDKDKELKILIESLFHRYKGVYGYRQIQLFLYKDHHIWINHKKVLRIMQELGLRSCTRKKYRTSSSSTERNQVRQNLLNRDFTSEIPCKKWVTDITQFRVNGQWLYVSVIKDLFNNEIISYRMGLRNDTNLVIDTFKEAFKKHKDVTGLIVHSDQGVQYTSSYYQNMLQKVGARISMSRRGNCYDNASMESFFSHFKVEGLYPYHIRNIEEAQNKIIEYINFYNLQRPQRKLNKLPPIMYREQLTA